MSISTRVLRKFTGDGDLIHNLADDGSDIDDTPFSSGVKKKQLSANRYDLLNQQSNSESECKDEYEDDNDGDDRKSGIENSNGRHSKESTKRKKKKKKKSSKSIQKQSSDDVDEVERSVKEVNAILGETTTSNAATSSEVVHKKGILCVEQKHLNPKNELRRIFGPSIIQNESSKRKNQGRRILKTFSLVEPRDNWPPLNKQQGLTMKLLEVKDGIHYFVFQHSLSYQSIEHQCMEAVESMYPANIMMIANKAPYHIDTLIQVSEIFKANEDLSMAAELIERALYSMESAFHPLFSLSKGNCRLDYLKQENRALYVALFKHLTFVGQRACYRTALEFCKVILNLQPEEDPLAIVLALDFYALRAREFDWFLNFVEELDSEKNLSQLPNIAFSKAVALFELSDPRSDEALQDALLMFPNILFPLLEKCGVEPDAKTRAHSFFNVQTSSQTRALNLLIDLYIQRNFHIWKDRDMLNWLERNSFKVLERVDKKDPLVLDYAQKRSRRFEASTPREIQRHVMLSDFKTATAALAENSFIENTYAFDPLPPVNGITLYPRPAATPREYDASNPFSLYFRSLLPNFQGQRTPGQEERGHVSHNVEFNDRMRTLLGAMRSLLSNLPLGENENEDHSDSEGESDDDDLPERGV